MAGKLIIVEPKAISAVQVSGGTGVANLLTADPKEVWKAAAVGGQSIDIDMGAAVTVDSFFMGYTSASAAASWGVYTATGMGAGLVNVHYKNPFRPADTATTRPHAFARLAAPVTSRYFRINYTDANAIPQVGALAMGLAFEATWDREWGSGRRLIDTSKVTQLLGGGFGRQRGARKGAYAWTFGDLTDAETEAVWAMQLRLGISEPLVVCEREGATSGANEQLHYGLFTRMDQFERREPNATKWGLEIEEWA